MHSRSHCAGLLDPLLHKACKKIKKIRNTTAREWCARGRNDALYLKFCKTHSRAPPKHPQQSDTHSHSHSRSTLPSFEG